MNQDLYIYYRVRAEDAQRFQAQAAAVQRQLAQAYDLAAALKRRPEAKDGLHTWMEVYLKVPQGFESTIEHAVADAGLFDIIQGPRHVEYFLDCSECA